MHAVLLMSIGMQIPMGVLTSDPVAVAKLPAYTGFISQAGIFLWSACVTTSWISASALARQGRQEGLRHFFTASGVYALMLGLDDVFLLHEEVFPSLGIPHEVVIGCYAALTLFYFLWFRAVILNTDYILLGIAFGCLGISAALDGLPIPGVNRYFFEDGAKLTGVLSWLVYLFDLGLSAICRHSGANADPRAAN